MDAKTQRLLEAARAQAAADRAAAADARSRLAAGNAAAVTDVADVLLKIFAAVPDVAELRAGADDIAAHLVALVAAKLVDALRIDVRDPRIIKGSVSGPGGPFDHAAMIIDTEDALLVDSIVVLTVDPEDTSLAIAPNIGIEVAGRINRSTDRARLLLLGDVDLAAGFITELYGLAARGRFTAALDEAVARRLDDMPTEEAPPA